MNLQNTLLNDVHETIGILSSFEHTKLATESEKKLGRCAWSYTRLALLTPNVP